MHNNLKHVYSEVNPIRFLPSKCAKDCNQNVEEKRISASSATSGWQQPVSKDIPVQPTKMAGRINILKNKNIWNRITNAE